MFLRDHWARDFPFLNQALHKFIILFFCLFFSGSALSQTFYDVLGVSKDSTQQEVKKSYRKLVSKWHTDRNKNPNAANKIQEITRAYRVLRDPVQRAEYDRRIGNIGGVIKNQPPLLSHRRSFAQRAGAKGVEFLISYVAFQLALVGHIYREYTTDQAFYGAPKNPDPGEEARQQFGLEGLEQFGIFYLGSEAMRWSLETLGKKGNMPLLTKVAGAAGMGAGYFISQLVSDVTVDKQVFGECFQNIMDGKVRLRMEVVPIIGPFPFPIPEVDFLGIAHIPPCQEAYLNWIESGKWEEYGVDLLTMLTASGLAHQFVRGGGHLGAALLNRTRAGSSLLSSAGRLAAKFPRVVGFTSPIAIFALSIYPFIEINEGLDESLGNWWKEGILTKNVSADIHTLNEDFSQLTPAQLSFLTGSTLKAVHEVLRYVHQKPTEKKYDPKAIQYLEYLAWDEEGQRVFISVLYGLDEDELERLMFRLRAALRQEQRAPRDKLTEDVSAALGELKNRVEALELSDRSMEKELESAGEVLENMISQIKVIGFRFSRWPLFKGRAYQESFFHWKNKTDKIIVPYIEAEQLLGDIYDKTVTIEQLQKQMREEVAGLVYVKAQPYEIQEIEDLISISLDPKSSDESREQARKVLKEALMGDDAEEDSDDENRIEKIINDENRIEKIINDENQMEKVISVIEKYRALINERLEFFTYEQERLMEDRDIYLKFLCPYLEDEEVKKKVEFMRDNYSEGYAGWIEFCDQPEQGRLAARPLVYQTLPILHAMLKEKHPDVYRDTKGWSVPHLKWPVLGAGGRFPLEGRTENRDTELQSELPVSDNFQDDSDDSQNISNEVEEFLKNYLSEIPDELFAEGNYHSKQFGGDTQGEALSLERADLPTKVQIARAFIKAVASPFPPVSPAVWDNMLEVACFIERTEEPEKCGERAIKLIREKLAAGAFFLLRDVLSPPRESDLYGVNQAVQERDMEKYHLTTASDTYESAHHTGFPLIGFAEVYKGEEGRFAKDTLFISLPEMSPYTFLHDFICGEREGTVRKGWFSAPQMVDFAFRDEDHRHETLSPLCDFLNNNQISAADRNPGLTLRNRYFHTPVMVNKSLYPSVYEMVEDWVRSFYKSERGKENVLQIYGSQTKTFIETASEKIRKDLKILKAEYIVPGMIENNPKFLNRKLCYALRDYYSLEYEIPDISPAIRVLDRKWYEDEKVDHFKNQLGFYKGLEIHLFQIQFWTEWMQRVSRVTGAVNLLDKNNTETAQSDTGDLDKVICTVLELLKGYHDSFVDGKSLAYPTPEEVEEIKSLNTSEALLEISIKSRNASLLLPSDLMWSLIVKAAYPDDWERIEKRLLGSDFKPQSQKETLIYTFAVELRNSIDGFYSSLNFLYLSDGLEEAVEHKPSGLPLFQ